MTTHSQLVDDMIRETRRPDLLADISDYLNQTIREIHFTPDRGNVITYLDNLRESQLTANVDSGFAWTIPYPALFQKIQAVRFDSLIDREGNTIYAAEGSPGRALNSLDYWWYRGGDRVVFSGYGGTSAIISLAYYEYPRRLKYFAPDARPATWDDTLGWQYGDGWDDTEELQLDARNLSSNWILLRWRDVVAEGLKAKVYKRLSDDARAKTSYSLYKQLWQGLYTSEVAPLGRGG